MFCMTWRRLPVLMLAIALHLTRFAAMDASAHANVSLRMLNGNLPVARVSVNGREPVEFVIDTGTNTTLIDPGLALRLSLKATGAETLTTLSGPLSARRYVLDSIDIGGESRSHLEALEQPMTQLKRFDPNIQGIIGLDFLRAFTFRLDYRRLQLDLYPVDEPPEVTGGVRVPLRTVGDRILVQAASSDAREGVWRLALDSGISRVLIFENHLIVRPASSDLQRSNFAHTMPAAFATQASTPLATNLSSATATTTILDGIAIGSLTLENVPAVVLRAPPATLEISEDGLFPLCLFRAVLIDRANSTVTIDPD